MAVLAFVALLAGCGDGGTAVPGGVAAGETFEYVVPRGTQQLIDKAAVVEIMPARLELKVGDILRIRNDDDFDQMVGPYLVRAGEQFELQYRSPGRFEGACALSSSDSFEIIVTD